MKEEQSHERNKRSEENEIRNEIMLHFIPLYFVPRSLLNLIRKQRTRGTGCAAVGKELNFK